MKLDLVESIIDFRSSYRECKNLRSKVIKDSYDKDFLIPIVQKYKNSSLKGKTKVQIQELRNFFEDVIKVAERWETSKSKRKSNYKLNERKNAVNNLKVQAKTCLEILSKSPKKPEVDPFEAPEFKMAKAAPVPCVKSIVFDFNQKYLYAIPISVRCYVILETTGAISNALANGKFDFKNYNMNGKNFTDYDLAKRKIYKVTSLPIKFPKNIGGLKVHVYISPNSWFLGAAIGFIDLDEEVLSGKDLDDLATKSETKDSL